MLTLRTKILLATASTLSCALMLTQPRTARGATPELYECSPCTSNGSSGTHDWTLSCCDSGNDCYMDPDANQYGNLGSCPGMHRPCGTAQ